MINSGDLVLIYKDEKRNYLQKVPCGQLHTDLGFFETSHLIGKDFGDFIETNLGHKFYLLKPTLDDMVMKIRRLTQIIYPKDIGMILMRANIFPGAKVIECGVGSGALTSALCNFVRPNGKVYGYERSKDFIENIRKNLTKYSLVDFWEIKHQEVVDEFDQKEVDFVMIDIGSQDQLVGAAYKSLKGGCRMATICPTFDQLTRAVFTMEETGFINIETLEIQVRKILVRRGKTRPEQHMPCHTGFLVFGTKINNPPQNLFAEFAELEPSEGIIVNQKDTEETKEADDKENTLP